MLRRRQAARDIQLGSLCLGYLVHFGSDLECRLWALLMAPKELSAHFTALHAAPSATRVIDILLTAMALCFDF